MPISRILLILLMILAGVFAVMVIFFYPATNPPTAEQNTKALIGGPFTLVDHHGKTVTNEDFSGKYMLVYFGYTYCPDVCPMDLQGMSDALDRLPEDVLNRIAPIFITIDPDRDTVEDMAKYVQAIHPNLLGLTGNEEQIKAVKKAYRVYGAKDKQEEGADPAAYLLSHTSYIYLMDRQGEYATHFRGQTDPEVIAKRLQETID